MHILSFCMGNFIPFITTWTFSNEQNKEMTAILEQIFEDVFLYRFR